ncbi:uncharacterized protein TNCV_775081 [Trichonephila clavipes]|nr:uncharacterized protein TNCV_775081 [Trichonephila clavipes]
MDAETATVLRGRAKAALTRTINFIDKNDQTFDKNDIRNKLEKLELTYTEFDKADAALPIESSEMEEFETKYYGTKGKLQNILENLSVRTYVYNENVTYEKQPYINKSKFNNSLKCSCKMNHLVFKCSKFKEMSVKERKQLVNKQKLCMNCLSDRHTESHCNSTFTCHYLADDDQKYQQILRRNNSNENIRTYKLKTVTYGLASASFLATRCIKQIALDDKDNPNLSRVLQEDIYMDDLLSGADTPNNAISICKDIAHVLSTRGFHLRKWNSNSTEFLAQFSEHSSHDTRVEFSKDSNESSKVLGLFWNSSNDTFGFQPSLELTPPLTKRRILSESSKIFDPLGLLSPCTVFIKIFYQKLWLTKTDWDSPIPQQLTEDWLRFQKAFNAINYLTVPRWIILTADNTVELHGFADASSLAYAAAIYCRQKHNGKIKVQLLVSKN